MKSLSQTTRHAVQKKAKTSPPRNTEGAEIRRRNFSATLGGFREVRRINFYNSVAVCRVWPLFRFTARPSAE
jgi:hypothetical protein